MALVLMDNDNIHMMHKNLLLLFPLCEDLSYTKMMQEAPISVAMIANRTEIQALNAVFTSPGACLLSVFLT